MPTLSLTPISSKTLKDCFKTQVEFTFGGPGEEVKKKIPVLHNVTDFEALLIWRSTFEEVSSQKGWSWVSMFNNVKLTLAGNCLKKWITCANALNTGRNRVGSELAWNDTMKAFMLKFCSKTDTEKLRDLIMNAKKPSATSIRDFSQRIEDLNEYLPYLPAPFNSSLDADTITLIIRRSVPTWNNNLVRSATRMNNIQDVTTYYQDLEELEIQSNRRNNNNNNRSNNNNRNNNNGNNNNNNRSNNDNNNNNRSNNNRNNNGNNNDNRTSRYNNNNNNNNGNNNNNRSTNYNNNNNRGNNYNNNNNNRGNNNNNNRNNNNNNQRYNNNNNNNNNRREINNIEEENNINDNDNVSTTSDNNNNNNNSNDDHSDNNSTHSNNSTDEIYLFEEELHNLESTPTTTIQRNDFRPELVVSIIQDNATKSKKIIRALIDTGCSTTVIRSDLLSKSTIAKSTTTSPNTYTTMAGRVTTAGKTTINFSLLQFAPHRNINHEVQIIPTTSSSLKHGTMMILGRDLIKTLGLIIDYSTDTPSITWDSTTLPIQPLRGSVNEIFASSLLEQAEQNFEKHSPSMIAADYGTEITELKQFLPQHLSSTERLDLLNVLEANHNVFHGQLGKLPGPPVHLRLRDPNVRPYHGRAFLIPHSQLELIKNEMKRLESLGVVRKLDSSFIGTSNSSSWAAPSFGIPKSSGQIRFVSDFRQLNKHLLRWPFPLPNTTQLFRTMDGFSYCTVMDLNMGFWAIALDHASQLLCTIVLPWGKYCYLRLPMGLNCSPDIYQEKISSIFSDLEQVIVYIDDICIITKGSFSEHLSLLNEVLQRLNKNNLKVHVKKCKFCCYETEFLGFKLTRQGLTPQQNKIEAILALRPPTTVRQVRSFLGFINYYKVFIPHRSGLLAPISNLVKKGIKFVWSPECNTAFTTLKHILSRQVLLQYPNFSVPFEIHTDASTSQIGSVITQQGHPIAFYSRKLSDAQSRYTITELELLSIVETLQEYRTVLLGHDIVVYTDHYLR